ncbi:MAG: hypothetical protein CME63_00230 [Halobacteriovoraceae bacterium]|nr:hypothetical protein [Halobacteriovoraceae bacterium]MBC96151.1 hypothetical protein [Halobacteriovoraceae bacterium]|tara:strand:+ start:16157 stop:17467 length:1311 start_codon:yes stop_codon:yes gene_type:complete
MSESVIFHKEELDRFESWLGLNYDAITWQGRYETEFKAFWAAFFVPGQSLTQIIGRFEYALLYAKIGPLNAWFTWLRNSFLFYIFIKKDLSILELSEKSNLSYDRLGVILRDFMIEYFPELEEQMSERFQVSNRISPNLNLRYSELKELYKFDEDAEEHNLDSVLGSMEITLYPEWVKLSLKMQRDLFHPGFDFSRIKTNLSFKRQLRVFRDIIIFLLAGIVIVFVIQKLNIQWEKEIIEKISIYEPQLKWLNTTLSFKDDQAINSENFKLGAYELDLVENKEESQFDALALDDEIRYEEESDVILTSWDSLPKDFDVADLEQSDYEEEKNRGYRDSRYGSTKVYRVLLRSVDTKDSKEKLNVLLDKYKVTQVDNVRPGKSVPGGIYYNIYVPRLYLKEFLAQVVDMDEAVLYESRTRTGRNPPGKNKVFIWVKNI